MCISSSKADKSGFRDTFFKWPTHVGEITTFIEQRVATRNLWFCTTLLDKPKREKANCLPVDYIWSDLDEVDHAKLHSQFNVPKPSCVVESSPGRYQGYWRLEELTSPDVVEEYNRRLAYHIGADKTGWDLTQLLRIPLTYNQKYQTPQEVKILYAANARLPVAVFDKLPRVSTQGEVLNEDLPPTPSDEDLPDLAFILYKFKNDLDKTAFNNLYFDEPHETDDWSARMWRLINICFEQNMSAQETFVVARTAKCNKYERDKRPLGYLWLEILKAKAKQSRELEKNKSIKPLEMPALVDDNYRPVYNFVTQYRAWAAQATDAVSDYHDLSAFMILSALVSSSVKCVTSWGTVYPNLWGLVLGDSTLTRKSTAMRMAMDLIGEIDPTLLLATDGSGEGIFTALGNRPSRVSIFFKDEVSGFFDSINRKDYMAGMPELFTQLYDVPAYLPRPLRKETITVSYPYFIFFGGGIKDKVFSLIEEHYILSGFLPRFLVVTGNADLDKLRKTGPATVDSSLGRADILSSLRIINSNFNKMVVTTMGTGDDMIPIEMSAEINVDLTEEAWEIFNNIEDILTKAGNEAHEKALALPTFTRLGSSILKMAILLAVAREISPDDNNRITVNNMDVMDAAYYGQKFGAHAVMMLKSAGLSRDERAVESVHRTILKNPGILKSELMQTHKLRTRVAKEIIDTLLDRGHIMSKPEGRGHSYWPIDL